MIAGNNVYAPIAGNQSFGVVSDLGLQSALSLGENKIAPYLYKGGVYTQTVDTTNEGAYGSATNPITLGPSWVGATCIIFQPADGVTLSSEVHVNLVPVTGTRTSQTAAQVSADIDAFQKLLFRQPMIGNVYGQTVINNLGQTLTLHVCDGVNTGAAPNGNIYDFKAFIARILDSSLPVPVTLLQAGDAKIGLPAAGLGVGSFGMPIVNLSLDNTTANQTPVKIPATRIANQANLGPLNVSIIATEGITLVDNTFFLLPPVGDILNLVQSNIVANSTLSFTLYISNNSVGNNITWPAVDASLSGGSTYALRYAGVGAPTLTFELADPAVMTPSETYMLTININIATGTAANNWSGSTGVLSLTRVG